jgi:hypothetical protein
MSFYGGHLGYYILLWRSSWILSFYGGHLGYYVLLWRPSWLGYYVLQWRSSWTLCPSMEVILDTMSFYGGHLGYYVLLWRSSWIFNQPKNHTLCQETFQCHSQQIQFQRTMTTDTKLISNMIFFKRYIRV